MSPLQHVFEKVKLGKMILRNRVVLPAMATCYATSEGFVTDQMMSYYARRAEGGVGLIIVEATYIDEPVGKCLPNELCIDDDKYLPGLSKLVNGVHAYGSKVAVQVHHGGPNTHLEESGQPVAPSPIPLKSLPDVVPRELTKEEIRSLIDRFTIATKRAKEAGFDAIELLCAHGYLINRFLSPHANKRKDEYGGSLEGRIRFLREIIESIKKKVDQDYPILCKVPGDDYVEGGLTLDESIAICQRLESLGVSAITITGGSSEANVPHIGPMGFSDGYHIHLAEKVKKAVKIPIITIGKIRDLQLAERTIGEGKADLVAIGRALIADPELVIKSQLGKIDEIIPCISCNHCLDRIVAGGQPLRCSVNPITGREHSIRIECSTKPKKILVIGGGPAGMEAAHIAASRGHEVTLHERNDQLGGQLLLSAVPPGKEDIGKFNQYLSNQVQKRGVKVQSKSEATRELIETMKPDAIVLAAGASPLIPGLSGVDLEHVVTAWDVLRHAKKVQNKVVIVGGGLVGCEVAEYLAEQGKQVTIVEMLEQIGLDIGASYRKFVLKRLERQGVAVITKALATSISKDGVHITKNSESKLLPADTIILAVGSKPNKELLETLKDTKIEIHAIGDCATARRIVDAVAEGFDIGCSL